MMSLRFVFRRVATTTTTTSTKSRQSAGNLVEKCEKFLQSAATAASSASPSKSCLLITIRQIHSDQQQQQQQLVSNSNTNIMSKPKPSTTAKAVPLPNQCQPQPENLSGNIYIDAFPTDNDNNNIVKAYFNQQHDAKPFRFQDYDCIGFDLDNTVCRYKVRNMVKLEYDAVANYLITKHSYSPKYLSQPIDNSIDFMIKGLILDVKKGNVLRISPTGKILHATHGTRHLTNEEIVDYYGTEMRWEVMDVFIDNPLNTWNGPLSESMRTLSDYFDMPTSLVFARAVDTLDEENGNKPLPEYNIYLHIVEALQDMFNKDHFLANKGGYFPFIKENPHKYIHKCSDTLIEWFKTLRANHKTLFLITGSNVDFATHTASTCMGPNWRDLFDIVVCFAKKPGFFTLDRPFIGLDGFKETGPVAIDDLQRSQIYSAGNWKGVHQFLKKCAGKDELKIVYVGDHIIQDVYTPATNTDCDTVAVCEELEAEGVFGHEQSHHDDYFLVSNFWGSYFQYGKNEVIWMDFLRRHAKLAVPSLEYVAQFPIDRDFHH